VSLSLLVAGVGAGAAWADPPNLHGTDRVKGLRGPQPKVTICHQAGPHGKVVVIHTSAHALAGHGTAELCPAPAVITPVPPTPPTPPAASVLGVVKLAAVTATPAAVPPGAVPPVAPAAVPTAAKALAFTGTSTTVVLALIGLGLLMAGTGLCLLSRHFPSWAELRRRLTVAIRPTWPSSALLVAGWPGPAWTVPEIRPVVVERFVDRRRGPPRPVSRP